MCIRDSLGPEGGSAGGEIVAEGTPEQVAEVPGSFTGCLLYTSIQLIVVLCARAGEEREDGRRKI